MVPKGDIFLLGIIEIVDIWVDQLEESCLMKRTT